MLLGKPKAQPKRIPVISLVLSGCRFHIDKVIATIYFEITQNLYGVEFRFYRKDGKVNKFHSDYSIPDPYRHMEHVIGASINSLHNIYGGYVKVERYEESSKTKLFNRQFFTAMELNIGGS